MRFRRPRVLGWFAAADFREAAVEALVAEHLAAALKQESVGVAVLSLTKQRERYQATRKRNEVAVDVADGDSSAIVPCCVRDAMNGYR